MSATLTFELPSAFGNCLSRMQPILRTLDRHDRMMYHVRLDMRSAGVDVSALNGHAMLMERFCFTDGQSVDLWEDTRTNAGHVVQIPGKDVADLAKMLKDVTSTITCTLTVPDISGEYDLECEMQFSIVGRSLTIGVQLPAYPVNLGYLMEKADPTYIQDMWARDGSGFVAPCVSIPGLALIAAFMANDVAPSAAGRKKTLDVRRWCGGNEAPDVYRTLATDKGDYKTPDRIAMVMPMRMIDEGETE